MKNNIRILLVEDEPNFGAVMKNYLEISDFDVVLCKNGKEGLESFENSKYDLCILDVMMPEMDGFTLSKRIKLINPDIPLIFLTAKALKEDIIQGYRLGADDYITKPFDSELLIYKIKAILSRNNGISKAPTIKQYSIGKFIFDPVLRTLTLNNQQEKLSPKESELLSLLCANMNQILPRENALRTIWGDDNFYTTRSMDVYITKLRKYLKPDSNLSIENIHGSGFRLLQINTPFDSTK
ncbi:response regulator transcription factor [Labilibaculum manganireducens]|uniref:DNA-binding response regulator n=1 Tax=Labilibaculum manganireducens TaxID=1940525 RepID=A0A2N3HRI8_9BACT|nr:response regulator transcription factor [Labilibaculum manganireducens]PKQ60666.1 DNA-binding response regulator [Labilibaculum manganireducens]